MLKAFKNTRIQKRENNNPKFFVPIVLSINEILIFEIIKLLSKYKAKIIIIDKIKIFKLADKLYLSSTNPSKKIVNADMKKIYNSLLSLKKTSFVK